VNFRLREEPVSVHPRHDKLSTLRGTVASSFSTLDTAVKLVKARFESWENGPSRVRVLDKLVGQARSLGELLSQQRHLRNVMAGVVWDEKYHEKRLRKENRVRSPTDLKEMKIFLKHIRSCRKYLQTEQRDLTDRISSLRKAMRETRRNMLQRS